MGKYDDIINLPHHVSKNHPQMSLENRAAQFAPFAALVGYAEAITSSQEQLDEKAILSEDKKEELESILHKINKGTSIVIKYHTGKKYVSYKGKVKTIDINEKKIIFDNRKSISLKDIYNIELISDE